MGNCCRLRTAIGHAGSKWCGYPGLRAHNHPTFPISQRSRRTQVIRFHRAKFPVEGKETNRKNTEPRILQKSEEEQAFIGNEADYPQNPINAFHLLYRIQRDWPKAHSNIKCDSCELDHSAKDFDLSYHAVQKQFLGLPSTIDVQGAADSVLRLWNVYKFDLKDFFDGIISDTKTKPLSAEEILYIARRAETNDDLYEAYHWLKELYRRYKNGEYSKSDVTIGTVAKALAGVYDKNGMPWKSLELLEEFKSDPKFSRHIDYYTTRSETKKQDSGNPLFKRLIRSPAGRKHHLTYESLCRGEIKVLNYGVGGMYEPHQDPLGYRIWEAPMPSDQDQCKGSGDRIATWMFYLSDVKIGGATVFPLIKARVRAEKGAAAFWYNFKRNGDQDYDTQHAGCPVLLGSKWVSNKWIREEGQMLRRRCGLNMDDIDTMYSNDLQVQWLS
ncbi:hypothetical protein FSP39_001097 [Pinctada imbricata]|uniref:procollagen-proline 4-dioxygenase n=1 Tax=Pinctada imbricata TaxID=66713 RepID=A0AA89BUE1_PINIB|nr:hypothetical protein FSP39_001097 [Pinctada imbricata]